MLSENILTSKYSRFTVITTGVNIGGYYNSSVHGLSIGNHMNSSAIWEIIA